MIMNIKCTLSALLLIFSLSSFSQAWKVYPYTPAITPTSEIAFPLDEGRHNAEPVEWWYTSGHFTGNTSGKAYSFMLTYFYYPVNIAPFSFDGFRILNITDETTGAFYEDTQPLNYTALSQTGLNIATTLFSGAEYWKNKLDGSNNPLPFQYELLASSAISNISFDLNTVKRPLIVGGNGKFDQGLSNYTYYYSQTKNDLTGTFTLNGTTENVTGTAWIDRQYGDFNPFTGENYEWFSIQLDNGTDLNLWNIFNSNREIPDNDRYRILSAYVDENQNTQYTISDFEIERLEYFITPDNLRRYSKKWRLTSASKNIDLIITSNYETSEVNITQLSFRFFEGSTTVTGTIDGVSVLGVGFAELLHDYENPNVSISNPSGGVYNSANPITWTLNNPDDGRPLKYDLEYSIDNKATFISVATGLTTTSYNWDGSGVNNGDDIWFKVKSYSIDSTLNNEVITSTSSSVTLNTNIFDKERFKYYPNPVQDELVLEFKSPVSDGLLEVVDLNGRLIYSQLINNNQTIKINTIRYNNGIYFLRLKSEGFHQSIKFIK